MSSTARDLERWLASTHGWPTVRPAWRTVVADFIDARVAPRDRDAALARPYQRRRSSTFRHLYPPPAMLSEFPPAEPPSSPPKIRLRVGVLLVLAHVRLELLRELRARVVEEARAERGRQSRDVGVAGRLY